MKVLAIGFHQGALNSLHSVLSPLVDIIIKLLPIDKNYYHYNLTADKADYIWHCEKDYFNLFDVIITSDTAILSRIFLQNDYQGELIVWICNRYDYWDESDGTKIDREFTESLRHINNKVKIVSYSKFDQVYAMRNGIYVEDVLKPVLKPIDTVKPNREKYYIPDYQNNYTFELAEKCQKNGLEIISGRHKGFDDLFNFKAIIHLPYHWQGVSEMEALSVGTPYYVPSKRLFFELLKSGKYWFQNMNDCNIWIHICNFYDKSNHAIFYFDSFEEITDLHINYFSILNEASKVYKYYQNKWKKLIWS
jgi:hypothetical protein